jgi:hypothetical protein
MYDANKMQCEMKGVTIAAKLNATLQCEMKAAKLADQR